MPPDLRAKTYRTEAVILRRTDYGETDRIYSALTPDLGRIDLIAKGARKPHSNAGRVLDYFARVDLDLARGRELQVVRHAGLLSRSEFIRTDLGAYGAAAYFAELVRILLQPREVHQDVYLLLVRSLDLLEHGGDPWLTARHFELALLHALGYQAEMFACVRCRRPLRAEPNAFSSGLGGMLCPDCRHADPAAAMISVNGQKYVRGLLRDGMAAVARLQLSATERQEIEFVTTQFARSIAEREFRSLAVMGQLNQAPRQAGE